MKETAKYYVSKIIDEDQREKHLFLEYLINGIIDVYYYRDDKGDHYFIEDANNQLSKLKNEEKEIFEDNKRYVKDSKEYIGLLKYTFRESPSISKKAEYIDLNHKSLIKISEEYHKEVCAEEECIVYEKKLPKRKSTFGIIAGLNGMFISQVRDLPEDLYFLKESQFGLTVFPSIGFYYKQRMPFINERLYFQYEGTYAHLKLSTNHSFIEPVYKMNYLNEVSYTQNMIHNLGYLKYEFPRGKFRPTFQFGGFANYFFNTNYHRDLEVLFSWGDTYLEAETEDNPFLKMNYGVNLGVGIKSFYMKDREIFVDLQYKRGFGLIESINTNRVTINLGLQLGK